MQKFQKMIKYLGTAISVVMVGLAILLGFSVGCLKHGLIWQ